jgi:hypothetical protein
VTIRLNYRMLPGDVVDHVNEAVRAEDHHGPDDDAAGPEALQPGVETGDVVVGVLEEAIEHGGL